MFRILDPFFHALSDGKIIRLTVAWVLRVLGVLAAIAAVIWFFGLIIFGVRFYSNATDNPFMTTHPAGVLLGAFLFAVIGLCLGYLWTGICFFRARSVLDLGDSHFTVLSIVSILLRLNGELIFVTYSLLGVGGCLFFWFADTSPLALGFLHEQLPMPEIAATGFMGGIEIAMLMLLIAFIAIVVSYALAELSIVLVEIALNTRGIGAMSVPASAGASKPEIPSAAPPVSAQSFTKAVPVAVAVAVCKHCGQPLETGAAFCPECGNAAR